MFEAITFVWLIATTLVHFRFGWGGNLETNFFIFFGLFWFVVGLWKGEGSLSNDSGVFCRGVFVL